MLDISILLDVVISVPLDFIVFTFSDVFSRAVDIVPSRTFDSNVDNDINISRADDEVSVEVVLLELSL